MTSQRPLPCSAIDNLRMTPKVSIGVPVYNGSGIWRAAIESLLGKRSVI